MRSLRAIVLLLCAAAFASCQPKATALFYLKRSTPPTDEMGPAFYDPLVIETWSEILQSKFVFQNFLQPALRGRGVLIDRETLWRKVIVTTDSQAFALRLKVPAIPPLSSDDLLREIKAALDAHHSKIRRSSIQQFLNYDRLGEETRREFIRIKDDEFPIVERVTHP